LNDPSQGQLCVALGPSTKHLNAPDHAYEEEGIKEDWSKVVEARVGIRE
jgi:hypothetical protein